MGQGNRSGRSRRYRSRAGVLAAAALLALALGMAPASDSHSPFAAQTAQAQNIGQRVVQGKVLDADAAVAGATVFLKNLKTKSIRSYTTNAAGRFRFTQVNMAEEYDLWAEKGGRKSATKSVSSWDSRPNFETELKLK
jgi:hypothetical protein